MRFPPQAVIGGSSLVHLHQEISHGAAARPTLTMIHRIIVRALRPSFLDLNSGYGLDWKIILVPADAWRNMEA